MSDLRAMESCMHNLARACADLTRALDSHTQALRHLSGAGEESGVRVEISRCGRYRIISSLELGGPEVEPLPPQEKA